MATTPIKKTYGPNEQLPESVAGPIQQSITKIQQGISSLGGGSSSSGSSGGVGAVNAQGQLVGSGGQVIGMANPADRPGAGSPRISPPTPSIPTPQAGTEQLDPNTEAPANMVAQRDQLQTQVSNFASSKGLKLQQNAQGQYSAVPDLSTQYQQTKTAMDKAGLNLTTAGQGSAAVQAATKAMTPQSETPSILGGLQETDSMFDSLFTQYDEFFSPQVQRTSLADEYSKLSKSLGLDQINAELIDAKRIIEGTESDIRLEVEKAGGSITASQLESFKNSRNKQLIKNYQYLVDTKNAATTQLSTLMELSVQDRRFAEAEFDRKMGWADKMIGYRERAINNSREAYNSIVKQVGYAGLLAATNGNTFEQQLIEKSLGLGVGGLTQLASLPPSPEESLKLENLRLQNEKLRREGTGGGGRPISSATALNLADSQAATQMLGNLESVINSNTNLFGPFKGRFGALNPYNTQAQDVQSKINSTKQIVGKFLEGGVLRKEDEAKYEKILPTLADTPIVAAQKLQNVRALVDSKIQSQQETLKSSGYNVNLPPSDSNIITGPDGNEYIITD